MKTRPYLLLIICILFGKLSSIAQSGVQTIPGWNMEEKAGGYVLKPQKSASETREFSYEILPTAKSNGQSFNDWFGAAIDKDLQAQGLELANSAKKSITNNQTVYSCNVQVSDKKGNNWYVTYISYQGERGNRVARVMSSDLKYYVANIRPVVAHFGDLSKQEAMQPEVAKAPVAVAREEEPLAPIAMNGSENGLGSRDINGFLILLNYNTSADGKMTRVYTPYMVLNDGSIYNTPVASPYIFNAKASRQSEPTKWGTWKNKNNVMTVNWTGRNDAEKWNKNWFWGTPAIPNEKIEGTFVTTTGAINDGLKAPNTEATSTIVFNNMGEFTLTTSGGGEGDFSKRNESGTYTLNEYGIELRFNNGTVLRRAFYFYLQGKTHFGIGNFVYAPKRNYQ